MSLERMFEKSGSLHFARELGDAAAQARVLAGRADTALAGLPHIADAFRSIARDFELCARLVENSQS